MKVCGKTTHQCPEMSQEKKSNIVIDTKLMPRKKMKTQDTEAFKQL